MLKFIGVFRIKLKRPERSAKKNGRNRSNIFEYFIFRPFDILFCSVPGTVFGFCCGSCSIWYAKMSGDGTFTPWRTGSRKMAWRTYLDGKTRGHEVKIPVFLNACPYYWKPAFSLLWLVFFVPFFFFAFRSTAVVNEHDVFMCWSRFVLICFFASRFPADHRAKNNWLHVLKLNQVTNNDSYQLFGTPHAFPVQSPHAYNLPRAINKLSFSTLRALSALFDSGITSKKLRRRSLETGGERFPSPRKASMVVWCFCLLLAAECLMSCLLYTSPSPRD